MWKKPSPVTPDARRRPACLSPHASRHSPHASLPPRVCLPFRAVSALIPPPFEAWSMDKDPTPSK